MSDGKADNYILDVARIETCRSFVELEDARGVTLPKTLLLALCDAALRWHTLTECSRVRVIGYARGGPMGGEGAIRHIGFEFTTGHPDFPEREAEKSEGLKTLIEFVDSAGQPHG